MLKLAPLIYFIATVNGLTEVILTRNQFNDFVSEIQKISLDINIEDGTINADLKTLETYVKDQNSKFDTLLGQNSQIVQVMGNLDKKLSSINDAIRDQTKQQSSHQSDWYKEFENVMAPVSQVLADVNNAISIIKETTGAISTIFEAFQGTQDAAVQTIETSVETIAANFEAGMRVVVAEALDGASVTFPSLECIGFEGDACANDPFGVGPIACGGTELEACEVEGIIVEPLR